MLFNVLIDRTGNYSFSPVPEVDKLFLEIDYMLKPGFPLEFLKHNLRISVDADSRPILRTPIISESTEQGKERSSSIKNTILDKLTKVLKKEGSNLAVELEWQKSVSDSGIRVDLLQELQAEQLISDFVNIVRGRQVAEQDFPFLAEKLKITQEKLLELMQVTVLLKSGEWVEALNRSRRGWRCNRCGSEVNTGWPSLYGHTVTCLSCKSIGSVSSLQVMYRLKPDYNSSLSSLGSQTGLARQQSISDTRDNRLNYEDYSFEFTAVQTQAAADLIRYSQEGSVKEILVWAACGAGKTEICFPVIRNFLNQKKRVLFVAPRQDVVHDLEVRLRKHFADFKIRLMSGAAPPAWDDAELTVATTHQVLRFIKAFDLIVFDETDAYPYYGNQVLAYGIRQALYEKGCLIYLTATPSEEVLNKVEKKECKLIRLPVRYHGHPMPVPDIQKTKLPGKDHIEVDQILKDNGFPVLRAIFEELAEKGPLLVFVPVIGMVKVWVMVLKHIFKDRTVEGSWSFDPDRRNKVIDFINGRINVFVCTSILERGVTVNGVQVAVLYAHHKLFDLRTLVQMAGRAGRTIQCPYGRVVFLAPLKTKAMLAAQNWIKEQNNIAFKEGLLTAKESIEALNSIVIKQDKLIKKHVGRIDTTFLGVLKEIAAGIWYKQETRCLLCGKDSAEVICNSCQEEYFQPGIRRCNSCGKLIGNSSIRGQCRDCEGGKGPQGLSGVISLGHYDGSWKEFIHKVKFKGGPYLLLPLADYVTSWAIKYLPPPDTIIPVPMHPGKLALRGFNQAEVLASIIARNLGINCTECLIRRIDTIPQTSLGRKERIKNMQGAFSIKREIELDAKVIWLVDDVITTGATIGECSKILRENGALDVFALCLGAGKED